MYIGIYDHISQSHGVSGSIVTACYSCFFPIHSPGYPWIMEGTSAVDQNILEGEGISFLDVLGSQSHHL